MAAPGETFIPMVSSTPPPMDDVASSDEEDEFGTFSSARINDPLGSPDKVQLKDSDQHFMPIPSLHSPPSESNDDFGGFAAFKTSNKPEKTGISFAFENGDKTDSDFSPNFAQFESKQVPNTSQMNSHHHDDKVPLSNGISGMDHHDTNDKEKRQYFDTVLKGSHSDSALKSGTIDIENNIKTLHSIQEPQLPNEQGTLFSSSHFNHTENPEDTSKRKNGNCDETESAEIPRSLNFGSNIPKEASIQLSPDEVSNESSSSEIHHRKSHDTSSTLSSGNSKEDEEWETSGTFQGIPSAEINRNKLSSSNTSDSLNSGSDGPGDDFGTFKSTNETFPKNASQYANVEKGKVQDNEYSDETFGDFDSVPKPLEASDFTQDDGDDDNEFGDFGSFNAVPELDLQENGDGDSKRKNNGDDNFKKSEDGFEEFGTSLRNSQATEPPRDSEFGDFGSSQADKPSEDDEKARSIYDNISKPKQTNANFGDLNSSVSANDFKNDTSRTDNNSGEKSSCKATNDADDFGSFSKPSGEPTEEEEDEFGHFGSFKTQDTAKAKTEYAEKKQSSHFAAFDAFKGGKDKDTAADDDDDDWASFSSPRPAAKGKLSSSKSLSETVGHSDDFGDFGSFSTPSSKMTSWVSFDRGALSSFDSSKTQSLRGGGNQQINKVFHGCFPPSFGSALAMHPSVLRSLAEVINDSNTDKATGITDKKINKKGTNGLGVWSVLSDMENTKAMGYQWAKSKSNKKLLTSLGLDERNILSSSRKTGVPIFAAHLGMLTPSKPGENFDKLEPGAPPEVNVIPSQAQEDSLPKVEFDWSGSGLTNPLDASTIDPEILNLGTASDPSPALVPTKPTSKPLEEILKNSSTSMVQQPSKREANLSTETNKVLDNLPKLSFMLAKVLMFPLASPAKTAQSSSGNNSSLGGLID